MTPTTDDRHQPSLVWLSLLTGALAMVIIGCVIGFVALNADVTQLNDEVAALKFGRAPQTPAVPDLASHPTPVSVQAFDIQIDGLSAVKGALAISLTIQSSSAADLLYQPPVLHGEQGRTYGVTPASLKAARFALLNLTTDGEAQAVFAFQPIPQAGEALTLVFNPTMPVGDQVAPHQEVVLRQ